ncbi:MAG: hypothetical protein MAG551_02044 [Candidatus Scalindua arabica]|uniref:Transporter n=1 Tax=Candidatus Scalindua arabica TaxID=1127984 RepID=A0A941W3V4_9BACT|nr:hypothetical protein [Candidatus Scalindua arabica]
MYVKNMNSFRILLASFLFHIICINNAFALRPFVTTNAGVVEKGKEELELGYFGIKEEKNPGRDELTIEFPKISLHYGLFWDIEFTMETVGEFVDDRQKGDFELREQQFSDTAVFLKKIWHRGKGIIPNFATETGILFPTEKGGERIDFKGIGIFTWEFKSLTFHTTIGGATERKRRPEKLGDEEIEVEETREVFIYGSIIDYEVSKEKGLHLVSEYSLEKVEKQNIEHQVLGGIVWEGPWNMEFDAATFWGLNSDSIDWGMTTGITILMGK